MRMINNDTLEVHYGFALEAGNFNFEILEENHRILIKFTHETGILHVAYEETHYFDLSGYDKTNKYIANYVYYADSGTFTLYEKDSIYYIANSLSNKSLTNKFQLKPNPNSGTFTLQYEPNAIKYSIRNMLGQIIAEDKLQTQLEQEIVLNNQPKGIYTVEIAYQNGEVKREKMTVE
jgi:hypothetical protein